MEGAAGLARYRIVMFQPLAPMLAQPADDMEAALKALGSAALEWKMDGARVQVHKRGDEVHIFTEDREFLYIVQDIVLVKEDGVSDAPIVSRDVVGAKEVGEAQ